MATPKQIQFVTDLKTELNNPIYGLDSVVEWVKNYNTVISGNYVCVINNSNTDYDPDNPRTSLIENVYYQIFLLINQTQLTDITIESVRLTKIEQVKTALYNVLASSTVINSGQIRSENQVLSSSLFDEALYIGYMISIYPIFTNSY